MTESTPKKKGAGKAGRVSKGRELAVVTLAAVASISGVGGLLAAGQHASTPSGPAGASGGATASLAQPGHAHKPLALKQASYRGEDGEDGEDAGGDDGRVVLRPAKKAGPVRQSGNVAGSRAGHASPPSAVSQGSAPVN
jgi:hypothetical protein